MNEENVTGKSEYEAKKAQRDMQKNTASTKRQQAKYLKRLAWYAFFAILAVSLFYALFLGVRSSRSAGEDFSRAVPLMGEDHIASDAPLPEYNSNPPTSGPHYGQTAQSGFREDSVPDQNIIHNLEHGDIWIAYHPRVSDDVKDVLKRFAGAKVIITPREANDTDIALASWGRLDTFNVENNTVPERRIKDFITRYSNKGPEQVLGASGGI
jgi:hypothetical protein